MNQKTKHTTTKISPTTGGVRRGGKCCSCGRVFRCTLYAIVVVLIGVFAQVGIEIALRQEYKVHSSGVVVISGTSTGIGRHAAFTLAHHGYDVFCGVRSEKDLSLLRQEANETRLEERIHPILLDVAKADQIAAALQQVSSYLQEHHLPLVGIVNNAGISHRAPLEAADPKEARDLFDINFWGSLSLTQAFLPILRKDQGRVIFVSSLSGILSLKGGGIYSASKHAIESLANAFRLELLPFGVSVSSILPGYIKTPISEKATLREDKDVVPPEIYQAYQSYYESYKQKRRENFQNIPGPEVTSTDILHALTNPFPQTRYYPGNAGACPGWLTPYILAFAPDRLMDRILKDK